MKYLFTALIFILGCSASRPTITYVPPVAVNKPPKPLPQPPPPINPKPAPTGDDWSPIFQHGIDSCIQNRIPVYHITSGRYICREPLILSNPTSTGYAFFTITILGDSKFAGADGFGTILDFSSMTDGFGIGVQDGKGVEIRGLQLIGAWSYAFPGAYKFYNTSMLDFTDGKCRDTRFSPYFAIVVDPFGPNVPSDGGYPNLSSWYKGVKNGSTGIVIEDCFLRNWVGGIITSPNGQTQNADLLLANKIHFENMKICVAGCQDQEKMNRVSNAECWGVVHTCFTTGLYGAGSVGNWYLDHWNIAGYTQEIAYNNQQGYFPSYFSDIFAESVARIGFIATCNGTTFSNSSINFADCTEAGSYTSDQISGYGVAFIGCQLRMYGTNKPITVDGLVHFRDCSFETVPFYSQSYPYGYSDFQNCVLGNSYMILNPMAIQTFSQKPPDGIFDYGSGSNVAAKPVAIDNITHKFKKNGSGFSSILNSSGSITSGQVIVASSDNAIFTIAGIVAAVSGNQFTVSYSPAAIDTSKQYYIYKWVTALKK